MKNITTRLKKINGQVSGLIKMLEARQDCEKIIVQFQAVRGAIDGAFKEILKANLNECLDNNDEALMNKILELIVKL